MNRRGFLRGMVGGVAAAAAVRTWPFRVYSFPGEIIQQPITVVSTNAGFLFAPGDSIKVDKEYFIVTKVTGSTITIARNCLTLQRAPSLSVEAFC